ncbi:MAG: hypothetical protein BJ554DRAFT_5678 [Olpidium bornovanus]|uniref:Uncharacterized protein n=1 Tax=Olpidium bornovanus TaxID=278681 RepID=A0A8H8DKM5_9FUNG|nr:MAG: hypothetical protein BJ554DRAFT_5678 [Olpidium bornovanus]
MMDKAQEQAAASSAIPSSSPPPCSAASRAAHVKQPEHHHPRLRLPHRPHRLHFAISTTTTITATTTTTSSSSSSSSSSCAAAAAPRDRSPSTPDAGRRPTAAPSRSCRPAVARRLADAFHARHPRRRCGETLAAAARLKRFFGVAPPDDVTVREIEKDGLKAMLRSVAPMCYFLRSLLESHCGENLVGFCGEFFFLFFCCCFLLSRGRAVQGLQLRFGGRQVRRGRPHLQLLPRPEQCSGGQRRRPREPQRSAGAGKRHAPGHGIRKAQKRRGRAHARQLLQIREEPHVGPYGRRLGYVVWDGK